MCLLFFFSAIQLTAGLVVGSGVSIGPLSGRHAAPAVVGRLGLVLDTDSGFAGHGDGRRNRAPPPKPPWFFEQETATELVFRFPIICGFKYDQ